MQTKNENKENPISFISKKIYIDINHLKNILSPNNKHGVCGSVNLGNTCYMNSSIACISNCTELTTFFLTKEYAQIQQYGLSLIDSLQWKLFKQYLMETNEQWN